eukprot:SAG11_NODE_14543_length_608_cov_1.277014_2_plen_26_part_01
MTLSGRSSLPRRETVRDIMKREIRSF